MAVDFEVKWRRLVCCKTCLFLDDTVLLAESKGDLQRVVNRFYSVCKRRKLRVSAGKSKVMVFEGREEEMVDINTAYRIRLPAVERCKIMLGSEKMEEVMNLNIWEQCYVCMGEWKEK